MLVGGARPNFMKLAPLYHAFRDREAFDVILVHTGQHYDAAMAANFFRDLGLPDPDVRLDVRSGSQAIQTARIIERFEHELLRQTPDLVVVVGDVNSTIACALAATKAVYADGRRPRLAHVEAGLRSGDRTMPEEINRVVTDALSDFLFVTEQSGANNLEREGRNASSVFFCGNVMIDTLRAQAANAASRAYWEHLGLEPGAYAVATLHRPSNVDDPVRLARILDALEAAAQDIPIVFPVHPRTRARMGNRGATSVRLVLCEPLGYIDFLSLLTEARLVLTDSGGVQEETTVLQVPCLTFRNNTERPVTVEHGTNRLIGTDPGAIVGAVRERLGTSLPPQAPPPLWDGRAAIRIVDTLQRLMAKDAFSTV